MATLIQPSFQTRKYVTNLWACHHTNLSCPVVVLFVTAFVPSRLRCVEVFSPFLFLSQSPPHCLTSLVQPTPQSKKYQRWGDPGARNNNIHKQSQKINPIHKKSQAITNKKSYSHKITKNKSYSQKITNDHKKSQKSQKITSNHKKKILFTKNHKKSQTKNPIHKKSHKITKNKSYSQKITSNHKKKILFTKNHKKSKRITSTFCDFL